MIQTQQIEKKINEIILLVCEENKPAWDGSLLLTEQTHLRDDLALDSLEMAELMIRLEDEFGIDVFENGVVRTVGEIYKRIV